MSLLVGLWSYLGNLSIQGVPNISVTSGGKLILQFWSLVFGLVTYFPYLSSSQCPGLLGGLRERQRESSYPQREGRIPVKLSLRISWELIKKKRWLANVQTVSRLVSSCECFFKKIIIIPNWFNIWFIYFKTLHSSGKRICGHH